MSSPPLSADGEPLDTIHKAIIFDDVSIGFEGLTVLDGVSFELKRGETKAMMGVAGSGKSTILKLCLGLMKPDRGHIYVIGHDVTTMTEEELFELRNKIGMVFQESALFDSLKVRDNVAFRLMEEKLPEKEIETRVREALSFVELEHTMEMLPSELSGGMRRRVGVARAIITQPEVLLYDSPTGGLDPITSTTIIELIMKQRDVYKTSALLVSHRLQDGFMLASHHYDSQAKHMKRIEGAALRNVTTTFMVLKDGKVIFDGSAQELGNTDNSYIREYIS
ncbi:MAG TPA: ATP-binding cassette domain-containing protein [Candidatus Saccharimonadales bacterium]|jgi:phospholipid/cholesterol/gamma-HCH transport system ATP-binding protein|nr:ATP-binding cassette domain-containing protein [Candidatus Saccharimonadales bacterium]